MTETLKLKWYKPGIQSDEDSVRAVRETPIGWFAPALDRGDQLRFEAMGIHTRYGRHMNMRGLLFDTQEDLRRTSFAGGPVFEFEEIMEVEQ